MTLLIHCAVRIHIYECADTSCHTYEWVMSHAMNEHSWALCIHRYECALQKKLLKLSNFVYMNAQCAFIYMNAHCALNEQCHCSFMTELKMSNIRHCSFIAQSYIRNCSFLAHVYDTAHSLRSHIYDCAMNEQCHIYELKMSSFVCMTAQWMSSVIWMS